MKKVLVATIFAAASYSAVAGNVTAFTGLNYDRANSGQAFQSQYELTVGASLPTKLGAFDAALMGTQLNSIGRDDTVGFEVGYSNGMNLGKINVVGRAAFGRMNQVDTTGGGFAGNAQYYSLSAEASTAIMKNVTGFVSFRHRNGLNADAPAYANRYAIGGQMALGKNTSVRLGYSHTRQADQTFNGLVSSINYKF